MPVRQYLHVAFRLCAKDGGGIARALEVRQASSKLQPRPLERARYLIGKY